MREGQPPGAFTASTLTMSGALDDVPEGTKFSEVSMF